MAEKLGKRATQVRVCALFAHMPSTRIKGFPEEVLLSFLELSARHQVERERLCNAGVHAYRFPKRCFELSYGQ